MIAKSFLPEYDHEFATLRTMLERVPEDRPEYQPHAKSMTLSRLAGHAAELPGWVDVILNQDELDFEKGEYVPLVLEKREDLLAAFDELVAKGREILENTSDETMMSPWTMRSGEQVYFTMPKVAVLRTWVFNHMIHHRAQLGVYLRLNDVPVPATYGPSADDTGEM